MTIERLDCPPRPPQRTLFISDLHLGALSSRPDLVLRFLQQHRADTYVLIGDILDLWHLLLPHWTAQDQADRPSAGPRAQRRTADLCARQP